MRSNSSTQYAFGKIQRTVPHRIDGESFIIYIALECILKISVDEVNLALAFSFEMGPLLIRSDKILTTPKKVSSSFCKDYAGGNHFRSTEIIGWKQERTAKNAIYNLIR